MGLINIYFIGLGELDEILIVKMLYNYKYYANYIIKALACHTVKFTL
jgi:hypothetical protein